MRYSIAVLTLVCAAAAAQTPEQEAARVARDIQRVDDARRAALATPAPDPAPRPAERGVPWLGIAVLGGLALWGVLRRRK